MTKVAQWFASAKPWDRHAYHQAEFGFLKRRTAEVDEAWRLSERGLVALFQKRGPDKSLIYIAVRLPSAADKRAARHAVMDVARNVA